MKQNTSCSRNKFRVLATQAEPADDELDSLAKAETSALPSNFCIIEGRETVQDFAKLKVSEMGENITQRRNKIFLLMEEVRRLRIQLRAASGGSVEGEEVIMKEYPSAVPFLPPLTDETIDTYYTVFTASVALIIAFGGIVAPVIEAKLGIGGRSYAEFIELVHLPSQLAQVDPFVASFTGGAVGVLSTLLIVEVNNVKLQAKKRCAYCKGTGYLGCAVCEASGKKFDITKKQQGVCSSCSGTNKVMCTSCFCTGMAMASEHDPRIDPFD